MEACNCNGRGAQSMVGSDGQAGRGQEGWEPTAGAAAGVAPPPRPRPEEPAMTCKGAGGPS